MNSFPRDANRVPVVGGVLSSDGTTPTPIEVDANGNTKTINPRSATAAQSSVVDSASSVTILAANSNRLGATIINDSSAVLYLLLGSGDASTTNYTVRMAQYGYYEVPFNYTGIIKGIWASDPGDGGARVTELT